jgi:hypothetical protein
MNSYQSTNLSTRLPPNGQRMVYRMSKDVKPCFIFLFYMSSYLIMKTYQCSSFLHHNQIQLYMRTNNILTYESLWRKILILISFKQPTIHIVIKMKRNQANLENDTLQFLPLALVFPSAVACFIIFNLPRPNFSHQVEKHLQMCITPLV